MIEIDLREALRRWVEDAPVLVWFGKDDPLQETLPAFGLHDLIEAAKYYKPAR